MDVLIRAVKIGRAIRDATNRGRAIVKRAVPTVCCGIVGAQTRAVRQMPYRRIVAVPDRGVVRLIRRDRRIAIEQIDGRISRVREGRNLYPKAYCAACSVVTLALEGKNACARRIRREYNVVTARVRYATTVAR